jgi:hypothetical protein
MAPKQLTQPTHNQYIKLTTHTSTIQPTQPITQITTNTTNNKYITQQHKFTTTQPTHNKYKTTIIQQQQFKTNTTNT